VIQKLLTAKHRGGSRQPPTHVLSLGAFVELGLIFCGVYLLAEASLKPLEADQVSIISAGVILALASVLLFYMIRPRRKQVLPRPEASRLSSDRSNKLPLTAHGIAVRRVGKPDARCKKTTICPAHVMDSQPRGNPGKYRSCSTTRW